MPCSVGPCTPSHLPASKALLSVFFSRAARHLTQKGVERLQTLGPARRVEVRWWSRWRCGFNRGKTWWNLVKIENTLWNLGQMGIERSKHIGIGGCKNWGFPKRLKMERLVVHSVLQQINSCNWGQLQQVGVKPLQNDNTAEQNVKIMGKHVRLSNNQILVGKHDRIGKQLRKKKEMGEHTRSKPTPKPWEKSCRDAGKITVTRGRDGISNVTCIDQSRSTLAPQSQEETRSEVSKEEPWMHFFPTVCGSAKRPLGCLIRANGGKSCYCSVAFVIICCVSNGNTAAKPYSYQRRKEEPMFKNHILCFRVPEVNCAIIQTFF